MPVEFLYFIDFILWLGGIIRTLFPWPFVVIFITLFIFGNSKAYSFLSSTMTRIKKIKLGQTEIEPSIEERLDIQEKSIEITRHLEIYRSILNEEIERLTITHQIKEKLTRVIENELLPMFLRNSGNDSLRATIYVPDFLIHERLCQIINYWPSGHGQVGRTFSSRYGIIGKVWRSEKGLVRGTLLQEGEVSDTEKISTISSDWGMDKTEARHALQRPSYCAVLLQDEGQKIGVLYIDSKEKCTFSDKEDDAKLIGKIEESCMNGGITKSIKSILESLEKYSPTIRLV